MELWEAGQVWCLAQSEGTVREGHTVLEINAVLTVTLQMRKLRQREAKPGPQNQQLAR